MKKTALILVCVLLIQIAGLSAYAEVLEKPINEWNVYVSALHNVPEGSHYMAYIENTSITPGGLYEPQTLQLRYFFTLDEANANDLVMLPHNRTDNGEITGSGPDVWDKENKVYYYTFEVTSAWKDPEPKENKYCHIDAMFNIMCGTATWNPMNDWSLQDISEDNTKVINVNQPLLAYYAPNFVLYDTSGNKLFGNEPPKPSVKGEWRVYTVPLHMIPEGSSFMTYIENTSKLAGGVYEPQSLKLRYFFTLDEENANNLIMRAHERLDCGEIVGSGPDVWDEENKVYYYTFDLTSDWKQPYLPENKYCHIDALFSIIGGTATWNPMNDWSCKSIDESNKIKMDEYGPEAYYAPDFVLYDSNGKKLYGNEPPKEEASNALCGDISADGKIDVIDLALIKKHLLGLIILKPSECNAGDLNEDGKVDSIDFGLMKEYLLGKLSALPVVNQI
ncbi:dockerin type I repeat-containing protein [Acetivibrio cellulolyticus]|uniref:dockerin type I repeat-containing protein n=1 Tax=Acetivibrio cellulolyticus TaxID=35830 RepID=UPI0001E2FBE3|nr:dockerin type I repeat-containing protein [Acetivibrio cellulolyticus]